MKYDPLDAINKYNKKKEKKQKQARKDKLKERQQNSWKRQNESRRANGFGSSSKSSNSGSNKTKDKDKSELEKRLWKKFSKYIRLRDCLRTTFKKNVCICITCGRKVKDAEGYLHAGHYISKSIAKSIKFDERNVHGQCGICNTNGGGKTKSYKKKLTKLYDIQLIEEFDRPSIKWEVQKFTTKELQDMLDKYTRKYKDLKENGIPLSEHKKWKKKYSQMDF